MFLTDALSPLSLSHPAWDSWMMASLSLSLALPSGSIPMVPVHGVVFGLLFSMGPQGKWTNNFPESKCPNTE